MNFLEWARFFHYLSAMKILDRNRHAETVIYAVVWLMVVALYLINAMRNRAWMLQPLVDAEVMLRMTRTLLPFMILFLVNNYVLIPHYLLKNKLSRYLLYTVLLVVALWCVQFLSFESDMHRMPRPRPRGPHHTPTLIPLPLFLDFTYALLVVGCNMAVALMFRMFDDRLERERLTKANAENQLAYLKAQINPHFYMNMLNNIHGMIEIDPERAQTMVIDMSRLMRYMLYDSSKARIPLRDEVDFISNYLRLMRQRYPESRVAISSSVPSARDVNGIEIPPLLFLVFIENAFKHGISYRDNSFVDVSLEVCGEDILFRCVNSRVGGHSEMKETTGIGLRNVSRRLEMLYGERAVLTLAKDDDTYNVELSIPTHDDQNIDN